MNKVYLQLWEEFTRDGEPIQDGCSLHYTLCNCITYVKDIYNDRDINNIPDSYDSKLSEPIEVFVGDALFTLLENDKNVRLTQIEMNNMIRLENIILKK